MKSLLVIGSFLFMSFGLIAQKELNVQSKKEVLAYLQDNKLKSESPGDFAMYVQIEKIASDLYIVLSNDNGKRKLFSPVVFQEAMEFAVVSGKGIEGGDFELQVFPNGNVISSGMEFKLVK